MKTVLIKFIWVLFWGSISGLQAQSLKPFLGPDHEHLGLMNRGYEVVVPAQYRSINAVSYYRANKLGFWVINEKHQHGLLNKQGKESIPARYDALKIWGGTAKTWDNTPLILFAKDELWGAINPESGKVIFEPQFKKIHRADEGVAVVKGKNDLKGLVKTNGDIIVAPGFREIWWESEGMRVVQDPQGKFGFMNTQGKLVISCRYRSARSFRKGFARVAIGKQWYYINRYGTLVTKTRPPEEFPPEEKIEILRIPNEFARPRFNGLRGKYEFIWNKKDLQRNLLTYVKEYIHIPRDVRQKKIEGEITIQFAVSEEGRLYHIKVLKEPGYGLGKQAVYLLRHLRKWVPARFDGRTIASLNVINIPYSYQW